MERIRTSAAISWLCLLLLVAGMPGYSAPAAEGEPPAFKPEELEALVAPIALYPDPLLAQVLMASTYPLEIVHAARWLKENPNLKGDAAVKAVGDQPWDVSVKSLVAFPQILEPMNQKLDWTQRLGDAFLAQQQDVFAAVQRLRKRAQDAGNLASTAQQKVIVDPPPQASQPAVVRIEPANPEVIYVPAYNPSVVYGGWSAPAYPPTYWPPPPAYYPGTALMSGLAFGVGLAAVGALYSDCNWGGGDVDIDYNKVTNIDRNFNRDQVQARAQGQGQGQGQRGSWQHNPAHRQGVAYRDTATRQKMAGQVPGEDKRAAYRGRSADTAAAPVRGTADRGTANRGTADRARGANRADAATGPGAAGRGNGAVRPGAGTGNRAADRDAAGNRAAPQSRGATGSNRNAANGAVQGRAPDSRNTARRDSAFTDVSAGGAATQRSHDRGRSSVQASGANRPSGGSGTRGAGGGGRGGGRR